MSLLDYESDKPFNIQSALYYIMGHQSLLYKFLEERIRRKDWGYVVKEIVAKDPVMVANLLRINYELDEYERKNIVLEEVTREGMLTLLLGAKRYGKTASAVWLIERLLEMKKKVYWYGFYPHMRKTYPEVEQILDITAVKNGTIIFDETLIFYLGRDAMAREVKERIKDLPTLGHRGCSILFLSQSVRVDPLLKDLMDFIWFKPLFTFKLFDTGVGGLNKVVRYMLPFKKNENFLINVQTQEPYIFTNPLPSRWDEQLSKPFSRIEKIEDAREFFEKCRNAFSVKEAIQLLRLRGWKPEQIMEPGGNPKDKVPVCPQCSSTKWMYWGERKRKDGSTVKRFRCSECGKSWSV